MVFPSKLEGHERTTSAGSNSVLRVSSSTEGSSATFSNSNHKGVTFHPESEPNHRRETSNVSTEPPLSARSLQSFCSEGSKSITYNSQNSLPRLPIPSLEETLDKFPKVLEALQDEAQQKETRRVVDEFRHGDGPRLQQALLEYEAEAVESGQVGSYVEEFWNESYLAPDSSVVLNLNPFFVLEQGPDPKIAQDQLRRAASLCFAAIKIASLLKHETLPPDVFRGQPLCMDQFKVLFGSNRHPTLGKPDDVHVYPDSTHVAVLCKNQFYYFPALWPDDHETCDTPGSVAVDEGDLLDILQAIQKHAALLDSCESSRAALGVLTSLPRRAWAMARNDLLKFSEVNATSLHVLDSALFVLVLDDFDTGGSIQKTAANMLHGTNNLQPDPHDHAMGTSGHGTTGTGATRLRSFYQAGTCVNRWYDKLQLIVCRDGTAGINFEHSAIDGHTALRFVSDVFAETVISFAESIVDLIHGRGTISHVVEAHVQRAAATLDDENQPLLDVFPKKLLFELNEELEDRVRHAETSLCDEIISSHTIVLEFHDFGKRLIVANKISPDSFVQLSMMLAFYKLYGKVVCTYEPVLTKSFFHGRTEAMRSMTPQVKELCMIWFDKNSTPEAKLHALREAAAEHSRCVKECAKGKGVDRHLFALKCIAQRSGMPVPAFFKSDAWATLNHTVLSTSNCGNPALRLFGFGPVVPDGLGIGYIIKEYVHGCSATIFTSMAVLTPPFILMFQSNGIQYSVSSKYRQVKRYVHALENTLKEMEQLLQPISAVRVEQDPCYRPSLKEVRKSLKKAESFHSYGDIWGESDAMEFKGASSTISDELKKHHKHRRGKFFATVVPQSTSIFSQSGANFDVDISLDDETDLSSVPLSDMMQASPHLGPLPSAAAFKKSMSALSGVSGISEE